MHSFHRAQGLRLWESGEGVLNLSDIRRLYVRKKEGFRQGEESLTRQLREVLGDRISDSAIYHRYDVDGLTDEDYGKAVATVFSEPPVDDTETALPKGDLVLGVEFLPGQYDQRADSAEQCLAIVTGKDGARVRCALVYAFHGHFEKGDREKIVKFLVNPVESREASLAPAERWIFLSKTPSRCRWWKALEIWMTRGWMI